WAQRPLVFVTELLAAIPSIVYGLWGIFVLVPFVRRLETGTPDWLKAVPLFSSSIAREVLRAVPQSQREGAYALGATRWEAIRMALFYARTGIVGAIML